MGKMSQILNYDFLPEQASLLPTRVGPEKKKTLLWRHTLEQDTMCLLFVFTSLLTSTSSQSLKMVQKKELDQYPVPSVGTVAQITYNIRND